MVQRFSLEPTIGIEPMTSSLPRKRSTPELRGPKTSQSGAILFFDSHNMLCRFLERETGFEPATLSLEG
jgi:hypothetical protein